VKINSTQNPTDSLFHDARTHLGINLTDTTTLSVATFIRSANQYNQRLGFYAWHNYGEWNFDDSNQTTLPEATTDLVDAQGDYAIPSTALDIKRVAVKDNEGNWADLSELRFNDIRDNMDEFYEVDGFPSYWYRNGNSIILKPAPATADVTLTAGLKVWTDRESVEFTLTATSTEPGFPVAFHRLISYGSAIDFAQANGMSNLPYLISEYGKLQKEYEDYLAGRSRKNKPKINRVRLDTI